MKAKSIAIILIFCFLMSAVKGSIAYFENIDQPLVLDELITEARQNNPEILAAKKRWEASQARIPPGQGLGGS